MDERVKAAARTTERASPFRALARGGYVANGVVHAILGGIAFAVVAQGGGGEADQVGALSAIAAAPLGFAALWTIAVLLLALGAFHGVHGFALRVPERPRRWGRRASEWGQALAFIAMGAVTAAVAAGARPDPDESAQDASRGLLAVPGGPVVLALVGVGLAVAGIVWIVTGGRRGFRKRMTLPPGAPGRALTALGAVGFTAKGATFAAVGILLVVASATRDPEATGGLDAAIDHLYGLPLGPAAIVAMGAGLVSYGVFCMFRARYADL